MVDGLIGAIVKSISDTFEGRYGVYTENVYQGAEKPCFFVECEKAERVEMLNRRFFVRVTVKITFENDSDEKQYEAENVAAEMFDLLGLVKTDTVCFNGRKIYGKWESGRFVIRACFDMWNERATEVAEMMEKIEVIRN